MDDDLGLDRPDGGQHCVPVGDVEGELVGRDDLQRRSADACLGTATCRFGDDLAPDLTGHPGHEHAHDD